MYKHVSITHVPVVDEGRAHIPQRFYILTKASVPMCGLSVTKYGCCPGPLTFVSLCLCVRVSVCVCVSVLCHELHIIWLVT